MREGDQMYDDRDRFVMVPIGKGVKRCKDAEPHVKYQCQLETGHKGDHRFWRSMPLMGWPDE